jgi:hypothetical protein
LLKFVRVSHHIAHNHDVHDLLLAAVFLLYLSAGTDIDMAVNEFWNAKFTDTMSDAFRVYLGQAQLLYPDANYVSADPIHSRAMLEAGIFEACSQGRFVPVAAFMFVDGWLCPAGTSPDFLFGEAATHLFPSLAQPRLVRGMGETEWMAYQVLLRLSGGIRAVPSVMVDPMQLFAFGELGYTHQAAIDVNLFSLTTQTRALVARPQANYHTIKLAWRNQDIDQAVYSLILSQEGRPLPIRRTGVVDLSNLGLTINHMYPISIFLAAGLMDDQLLVVGQVGHPYTNGGFAFTDAILVWGPPEDAFGFVVPAKTARTMLMWAQDAHVRGNSTYLLRHAKLFVMSGLEDLDSWQALNPFASAGRLDNRKVISM